MADTYELEVNVETSPAEKALVRLAGQLGKVIEQATKSIGTTGIEKEAKKVPSTLQKIVASLKAVQGQGKGVGVGMMQVFQGAIGQFRQLFEVARSIQDMYNAWKDHNDEIKRLQKLTGELNLDTWLSELSNRTRIAKDELLGLYSSFADLGVSAARARNEIAKYAMLSKTLGKDAAKGMAGLSEELIKQAATVNKSGMVFRISGAELLEKVAATGNDQLIRAAMDLVDRNKVYDEAVINKLDQIALKAAGGEEAAEAAIGPKTFSWLDAANKLWLELSKGVADVFDEFASMGRMLGLTGGIMNAFNGKNNTLLLGFKTLGQIIGALGVVIIGALGLIVGAVGLIGAAIYGVGLLFYKAFEGIAFLFGYVYENWTAGWKKVESWLSGIWTWLVDTFSQIGKDIWEGLWGSFYKGITSSASAIKDAVGTFPDTVKKALGIASPSKVMMELGKFTAQGFEKGYVDHNPVIPVPQVAESNSSSITFSPSVSVQNSQASAQDITNQIEAMFRTVLIEGGFL